MKTTRRFVAKNETGRLEVKETNRRRDFRAVTLQRTLHAFFALVTVLTCCHCASIRPTEQPIPTVDYPSSASLAKTLIVFLPGRGTPVDQFEKEGFIKAASKALPGVDMIAVDAHLGYYHEGVVVQRLREEVIGPAKSRGYKNIWLVGTSLGGMGALLYGFDFSEDVSGIVLIAPYLGEADFIGDIEDSGGLDQWQPDTDDVDRMQEFWVKLRGFLSTRQDPGQPPLFLLFGEEDRFAKGHRLLARNLEDDSVISISGRHRWTVWIELWQRFLERKIF